MQRQPRTRFFSVLPLALLALPAASGCSPADSDPSRPEALSGPNAASVAHDAARASLPGPARRWRAAFGQALASPVSFAPHGRAARLEGASAHAELAAEAPGVTTVTDSASKMSVGFALEGAAAVPLALDSGLAVYKAAGPEGADLLVRATHGGVEDFVAFERRPGREEITYAIDVRAAAGLRFVEGSLELLDKQGAPRLRVAQAVVIDAHGARHAAALKLDGCAYDTDPRGPWGRPVTAPGAATCSLHVSWEGLKIAYPALVDPAWSSAATAMAAARTQATATLVDPAFKASRVLIAGGFDGSGSALASAELYEPLSRTFAATGSMAQARGAHAAVRLAEAAKAPVLVSGGLPSQSSQSPRASLELYDPDTGFFGPVKNAGADVVFPSAPVNQGRSLHTATLLSDGVALLAGGAIELNQPSASAYVFTFSPGASTLALAGAMQSSRAGHAAVRLPDGQVLITGGFVQSQSALKFAETFDPGSSAFKAIAPLGLPAGTNPQQMKELRAFHTATLVMLPDPSGSPGDEEAVVVISGGVSSLLPGAQYSSTVELYEHRAAVRGFSALVSATTKRARHTATQLPTGDLLFIGGTNENGAQNAVEQFHVTPEPKNSVNPTTGQFVVSDIPALLEARYAHIAALVNAGEKVSAGHTVMVAGGVGAGMTPAVLQTGEVLLRPLGETCGLGDECLSGFCVDGVCCDTACDTECYSCAAVQQQPQEGPNDPGPKDGTCRAEKESAPPAGEKIEGGKTYAGELPTECNTLSEVHFKCDGHGLKKEAQTFPCLPSACSADKKFCEKSCNCNTMPECEAAMPPKKCYDGGWCSVPMGAAEGECKNRGALGTPCANTYECADKTFCVDGVCCSSTCEDQCAACNLPGFQGTCLARGLQGDAPPELGGLANRMPCLGDGTPCAGTCKGDNTKVCAYPGEEKVFSTQTCECQKGDCTLGPAVLTKHLCDGVGSAKDVPANCGAAGENTVGGLKCAEPFEGADKSSACLPKCEKDDDCFKNFYCDVPTGLCQALPDGGRCDETGLKIRETDKDPRSCGDYICQPNSGDPGGKCLTACAKKSDCTGDLACNTDGKCTPDSKPAPAVSSCSIASTRQDAGAPALGLLLALGALCAARARRRA